jgi:hypothetical protein
MKKIVAVALISLFTVACSKNNKIDQIKFESLYRAIKTLDTSATVGVNLIKFRELIQQTATELSIAKDKAIDQKEKDLVALYENALAPYIDSLALWNAQLESKDTLSGGLICSSEVFGIAEKYQLKCLVWENVSVIPKQSLQYLWAMGSEKIKLANSVYLGSNYANKEKDIASIRDSMYSSLTQDIEIYNGTKSAQVLKREMKAAAAQKAVEKEKAATQKEEEQIKKIWDELIMLSHKALPGDTVVCINPDSTLYHRKNCPLLRKSAICIKQIDLPSRYEVCTTCLPKGQSK